MTALLTIHRPTPPVSAAPVSVADSAVRTGSHRTLAGLRVGLRTEGNWKSWIRVIERWSELLSADGAIADVLLADGPRVGDGGAVTTKQVQEWAAGLDVGISGLGTCGSCTSYTVVDGISIANAGKPSVVAITEEFVPHARSIAAHLGHGELEILTLPHPMEGRPDDELDAIADEYYPVMVEMLAAQL